MIVPLCIVPALGRDPWVADLDLCYSRVSNLRKKTAVIPNVGILTRTVRTTAAASHPVYHSSVDDNYPSYRARWT